MMFGSRRGLKFWCSYGHGFPNQCEVILKVKRELYKQLADTIETVAKENTVKAIQKQRLGQ